MKTILRLIKKVHGEPEERIWNAGVLQLLEMRAEIRYNKVEGRSSAC